MDVLLMHMGDMFSDEGWAPEGSRSIDLRDLEGTTGYCSPEAQRAILEAVKAFPVRAVHFIDSGDYHYLTALWMSRLQRESALLLFDHHSDDQPPAFGEGLLSCGSWVCNVRNHNPMYRQDASSVYISIDLDYLSPAFARTNWDQGVASAEDLIRELGEKTAGREIAGVDICGGITASQGGTAEDFAVNIRTREMLLEYFKAF